ncbi:peroxidase-like [Metopolophium dirhodum]|uniref:peroxidase-like n=1 Tax=Metopolophium dirhodum TaxID=44670 RepID=UPI00298FC5C0|nr:peroxidase-like [Metopolophium dirhodum]
MGIILNLIRLFVCTVVIVPLCCRGLLQDPCLSKDRQILDLCEQALEINSTNWYQNIRIPAVNEQIVDVIDEHDKTYRSEDVLSDISRFVAGSPNHGQLIDSQATKVGISSSRNAEVIVDVTRNLKNIYCKKHGLSDVQCAKDLSKVKITRTSLSDLCLPEYYNETMCIWKNLDYPSIDGSCNNLKRSSLGKATMPYKRLLFPVYADGIYNMSEVLPNPRSLSIHLVNDEDSVDQAKTMMMAYWAIFIGHDLSQTVASNMGNNNVPVKCCYDESSIQYILNKTVKSCKPISIPEDDKVFPQEPCMNYVRSQSAMRPDCSFGPREQMNQATHYLDASMIYGSSEEQLLSLRKLKGGELSSYKMNITNGSYMPLETTETKACQHGNGTCFRAGDIRANALPQLTLLHTLWMREHNRIARELSRYNPQWTDEQLFLESKKVVTAFIQHVTYNEWLPALLGVNYTKENGLGPIKDGRNTYDDTADPTVSNSFATAILPFANSMISENISLYSEDRVINGSLSLKEYYNRPVDILTNYTDALVRGLITQNTQNIDMLFTKTLTNYLYSFGPNYSSGMDVVSLDIQRSRDHGIPSYTQFRKYCGLDDIETVEDLSEIMVEGAADRILKQYKNWNDIDLMVGALSEKHADDAMVGPTMRCIIREQFVRTRSADRYFYDVPGVFNKDQLAEIRKFTLARFICLNANNVTTIQKQVFLKPASTGELKLCKEGDEIPRIFVSRWAELAQTIPE